MVMARPLRFTPAGVPVHVTQRGNFRALVFTEESDYLLFLRLLKRYSRMYQNRVVGYCLMPNHVHLVVVPVLDNGVTAMMRVLSSTYSRIVNEQCGRKGHGFEARFGSASMSDRHYRTALAYVDLNPGWWGGRRSICGRRQRRMRGWRVGRSFWTGRSLDGCTRGRSGGKFWLRSRIWGRWRSCGWRRGWGRSWGVRSL